MMRKFAMVVAAAGLAACTVREPADSGAQPTTARPAQAESEAYMRKAEEQWSMLGITKDRALLPRILAEDYVGMSTAGEFRDKAETIRNELDDANDKAFVSAKIDALRYTHFGDTVIAQGRETFKRASGQPDYRIAWTDVWLWRDGRWQVIASQAALPPAGSPPAGAAPMPATPADDPLTMRPTQNGLSE